MAISHAASGEPIDLFAEDGPGSIALVRNEHFEVFRLAMEAGKELPEHAVESLITIQCLRGRIEVGAHGGAQALRAGCLLYLSSGVPHTVRAVEDSLVLVTMLVSRE